MKGNEMDNASDTARSFVMGLSPEDFRFLGIGQIAYLRPVMLDNETTGYAIHAADGTRLSVMESLDLAQTALLYNDLHPVTLQ